jgi:hypothetical protein
LWIIDRFSEIGVSGKTRNELLNLLDDPTNPALLNDHLNKFCLGVYEGLRNSVTPGVANAFWRTLHNREPVEDADGVYAPDYNCLDVGELRDSPALVRTDRFGNRYHLYRKVQPIKKPKGFALVERWREAPWFIHFIKYILARRFLPIARLEGKGRDSSLPSYAAVFPVKTFNEGTRIFTSTDNDLGQIDVPLGLSNFYCIEVAKSPADPEEKTLCYRSSWNRGFWSAPVEEMREYFFPWAPPRAGDPQSACRPENPDLDTIIKNSPGKSILFAAGI